MRWLARTAPALALGLLLLAALLGPWLAGRAADEADLASSLLPPLSAGHPLGTDLLGRDVLAGSAGGLRASLVVAGGALAVALSAGLLLGLAAGLAGGVVDFTLMRGLDVLSAFPALLLALLLDGVLRLWGGTAAAIPDALVVVGAIGLARLPPLARVARGSARAVWGRDFLAAARLSAIPAGRADWRGLVAHMVPNVIGPMLVLATLDVGLAVTDEATLSFLGLGLPPSQPSLGTLIRLGQDDLLSGVWWPVAVPGVLLVALVVAASRCGELARARLGR